MILSKVILVAYFWNLSASFHSAQACYAESDCEKDECCVKSSRFLGSRHCFAKARAFEDCGSLNPFSYIFACGCVDGTSCRSYSMLSPNHCVPIKTTTSVPIKATTSEVIPGACWDQSTNTREDYMGNVTKTRSGRNCQRWDTDNDPHEVKSFSTSFNFPDETVQKAENYCRNPISDPNGPWCYTEDPARRWEYCDIPTCDCGTLAHTGLSGTLSSPNYPNDYPNNAACNWTITMPAGETLGIRLNELDIEDDDDCGYDSLKFYDKSTGALLDTHCGKGMRYIKGTSNAVLVAFKTDKDTTGSGFELEWGALTCEFMGQNCRAGRCGSVGRIDIPCIGDAGPKYCGTSSHTGTTGTFHSPNYPNDYPNNAACNWTIAVPQGEMVEIWLNELDIQYEVSCENDSVKFYDNSTGALLNTVCGKGMRSIEGTSNTVLVAFKTDGDTTRSGFKLEWRATTTKSMTMSTQSSGSVGNNSNTITSITTPSQVIDKTKPGSSVKRRLEIKALYKASCSKVNFPTTMSTLRSVIDSHFRLLPRVCVTDCRSQHGSQARISCSNDTLSVIWPTDRTFLGDETFPLPIQTSLNERAQREKDLFQLVIVTEIPPILHPDTIGVVFTPSCPAGLVYMEDSQICQDFRVVKRLELNAMYKARCNRLNDPVTMSTLHSVTESLFQLLPRVCMTDCGRLIGSPATVSCMNDTLSVTWPTDRVFSAAMTPITPLLLKNLNERAQKEKQLFQLVIVNEIPP